MPLNYFTILNNTRKDFKDLIVISVSRAEH